MRSSSLALALFLTIPATTTRADGLVFQLPADGSSVRYDLEVTPTVNGAERNIKGSLTMSSVGRIKVENDECRWIEFKMVLKNGEQDRTVIAKALVPEKHLGKGKSPGENMIRGWVKEGDQDVVEIKDLKNRQAGPLVAFLGGPLKSPRELEKVEIDGKLGKLMCVGVAGDYEFDQDGGTVSLKVESRLHEKAPFGIVTADWKFERKNNGQVSEAGGFKLTLADTNTTALTELPDRN